MFKMHKANEMNLVEPARVVCKKQIYEQTSNSIFAPWSLLMAFFTAKWLILFMQLI